MTLSPRSARRLASALAALALTGCISPALTPMDPTPLPARGALKTVGGYELSIDLDGTLVSRPARGDTEASFGASLAQVGTRVVVTGRMRAETPLQVGDVLLRVRAESAQAKERAQAQQGESEFSEAALAWRAVGSVADLRGYDLAWMHLSLEVERGGHVEIVELELGRPEPVAVRYWSPEVTRRGGFLACRIQSLPLHLRPARVYEDEDAPLDLEPLSDEALLVLWVATDSTFGVGGLRPLQVATFSERYGTGGESAEELQMLIARRESRPVLELRDVDGRTSEIEVDELTRQTGSDTEFFWILARVEDDPVTTRVLVGPSGWIYAHRRDLDYNPRTDRYERSGSWSMALGLVAGGGAEDGGRGSSTLFSLGLPNVLDTTGIKSEDDGYPYSGPFAFDWD